MPSLPPRSAAPARRATAPRFGRGRGAVLIVALLVAALIALMLGSYLNLNLSSTRMAKRTFDGYSALNLAEAGTEEAVWSFNRTAGGDATAWDGWTKDSGAAWQKFANFELGANTSAWVKVYVDHSTPDPATQPKVVAQSSLSAGADAPVTRMVEVTLRRRAFFANGLVAKDSVAFSGAVASVDSWVSDPDHDPATPAVPYSPALRRDHGSVASAAVLNSAVLVNQANIWGTVATGGGQPQVGATGTIRGADTPAGVRIDSNRISTDFNAEFAPVTAPTDGTTLLAVGPILGTAGQITRWRAPAIILNGTDTLTIAGEVTLVLTSASGTTSISVTGSGAIVVPAGCRFSVYTEGDVKIAGRGLANANAQPLSCQFWGTSQSAAGQSIAITGNGALGCVVYAPNGFVTINGNGDVMGSVVSRTITLAGNAAFHYDESLADFDRNQPFGIAKWRELTTAADRSRYLPFFNGW
jgi:hypothetical protein